MSPCRLPPMAIALLEFGHVPKLPRAIERQSDARVASVRARLHGDVSFPAGARSWPPAWTGGAGGLGPCRSSLSSARPTEACAGTTHDDVVV
eukprot:CAMPEP_0170415348 /NCGR_PEP_ID=MMETSP0117_2-20130122/32563_1 /TAXON_ID=400756 /ORGANISM="Durinskia baltica, Strain CSIRO CS-38" /LENGTH=91 /DNA_ID=CAMNT_0010673317 /DNA_START=266 /DNA_END=542 /DNA_ORIENTATION=-